MKLSICRCAALWRPCMRVGSWRRDKERKVRVETGGR